MLITEELLRKHKACKDGIVFFKLRFPNGIEIEENGTTDLRFLNKHKYRPEVFFLYCDWLMSIFKISHKFIFCENQYTIKIFDEKQRLIAEEWIDKRGEKFNLSVI